MGYRIVETTSTSPAAPDFFQCQETMNEGVNWVDVGPKHASHAAALLYLNTLTGSPDGLTRKIHEYNTSNKQGPQKLWD